MDEFDVFMDAMSRNIAIKQVIDFAKRDSSRQMILITPQVSAVSNPNPNPILLYCCHCYLCYSSCVVATTEVNT